MDIGAALGTVQGAIQVVGQIIDADKALDQAQLKSRPAEVSTGLANANIALAEAQTAIAQKDAEISRLQDAMARKANVIEYQGFWYEFDEPDKPKGKPFCPRCLEMDQRFHRLQNIGKGTVLLGCPQCQRQYGHATVFE